MIFCRSHSGDTNNRKDYPVLSRSSALSEKSTPSPLAFVLGGVSFTATMISQPRNGSLLQLTDKDEGVRTEFRNFVGSTLCDLDVSEAYAPKPKFTDYISKPSELVMGVPVGPHVLHRNRDGEFGDGVLLRRRGEAYVVSPSSCPTTVMVGDDGTSVALHTGRFCLIDQHGLEKDVPMPGRKYTSIVFSALELLGDPKQVHVKPLWSIPPHLFVHDKNHPTFGKTNEKMRHVIAKLWGSDSVPLRGDKFWLDLPKLVRDQCISRGVPEDNIDLTHAYQPPTGTWIDGAKGTPRNLVVVSRHS